MSKDYRIPLWEKITLTVEEAAALSGVGQKKIRELLSDPLCEFALSIGSKTVVKRELFEKYLLDNRFI